jgi:RNA polymerase sigma-70 factor (ECF subfamily)
MWAPRPTLMRDDTVLPAEVAGHAAFVRRLAFHLLRNEADADDASQEALARTLEHPPRRRAGVRGWLTIVLRNVVRKDLRQAARRGRRERTVARQLAVASVDDTAAREEIFSVVTDAVRALDSPSREVLLLRHYEGLPPREIAVRLGVPLETVKSRLSRAHARLRADLDEGRGGNVEGWRSTLAALVGLGELDRLAQTGMPVGGGIAVATATKFGVGIVAAVLLVLGVREILPGAERQDPRESPGSSGRAAEDSDPLLAGAPRTRLPTTPPDAPDGDARHQHEPAVGLRRIGRLAVKLPVDWVEEPGETPGSARWTLRNAEGKTVLRFAVLIGQVEPDTRRPVLARRDVEVLGVPATWTEVQSQFGVVTLVVPKADASPIAELYFVLAAPADRWEQERARFERILSSVEFLDDEPVIVQGGDADRPSSDLLQSLSTVVEGRRVEGVVLRGSKPAQGISTVVTFTAGGSSPVPDAGESPDLGEQRTTTDAQGVFRFGERQEGPLALRLRVRAETWVWTPMLPLDASRRTVRRLLVVLGPGAFEGKVYDPAGVPASGTVVQALGWTALGQQQLAYRTVVRPDGTYRIDDVPDGRWILQVFFPSGVAKPVDTRSRTEILEWGGVRTVDFGGPHAEALWTGTVRTRSGQAVMVDGLTLHIQGADGSQLAAFPDGEGRFNRRLPAGRWEIRVGSVGVSAIPADVVMPLTIGEEDIEQDFVLPGTTVAGEIANWRGTEGGSVIISLESTSGGRSAYSSTHGGEFRFYGVPIGRYELSVRAKRDGRVIRSDPVNLEVQDAIEIAGVRLELPSP